MEEKQNTHVERQHAQIDQLEQDFRNRQQEADDKLRFLLEEKTKLERQVSQLQEDLEINKDDQSRIREALEEENRYLLSEREKQQVRLLLLFAGVFYLDFLRFFSWKNVFKFKSL